VSVSTNDLKNGMSLNLPEHGGVRIEDTVVVTPDGCRPVTRTPKELVLG